MLVAFTPVCLPGADGIGLFTTKINKLFTPGAQSTMELQSAAFRLIPEVRDTFCFSAPDFAYADARD